MPVSKSKDIVLLGLCTIIKINMQSLLILQHCTQCGRFTWIPTTPPSLLLPVIRLQFTVRITSEQLF